MFDEASKEMARPGVPVELSYAKGSIQAAARELAIDPGRISKWRRSAAAATAQKERSNVACQYPTY
ncbi:hypothetical protein [Spirosoma linguale]|uniref:hypothetical protein n=1 Tax=Spirosoma linguale TaxID=108 RepID=UPI000320FD61